MVTPKKCIITPAPELLSQNTHTHTCRMERKVYSVKKTFKINFPATVVIMQLGIVVAKAARRMYLCGRQEDRC